MNLNWYKLAYFEISPYWYVYFWMILELEIDGFIVVNDHIEDMRL